MAFTGDLEHLPIVDVIQLMNSTRKTGVLSVKGRKGESQLVFKDGYIVSANHLNNSVRIGDMLVSRGKITEDQLEHALQKQKVDGPDRKPLAITLIEMGIIAEEDAFKALQNLIEMTVVDILTWKSGKFTLDHLKDTVASNFKYYPERMSHEINVNTQSILMDALRIFDEKKRDGLIDEEPEEPAHSESSAGEVISADDLGLSEIESLSAALPQTFSTVAPFDPVRFQLEKLQSVAPELVQKDREKIAACLARYTIDSDKERARDLALPKLVLASDDSLLIHALETVTTSVGVCLMTAGGIAELEATVAIAVKNGNRVRVVFDAPASAARHTVMKEARNRLFSRYPGLVCLQLVGAGSTAFSLEAYRCGVKAVIPRPYLTDGLDSSADEFIALAEALPSFLM